MPLVDHALGFAHTSLDGLGFHQSDLGADTQLILDGCSNLLADALQLTGLVGEETLSDLHHDLHVIEFGGLSVHTMT